MDEFTLFLKLHFTEILFSVVLIGGSGVLAFILYRKPEKLGFKKPFSPYRYLLCAIPLVVLGMLMYQQHGGGITGVERLDVAGNSLLITGYDITYRERSEDGLEEEIRTEKFMLFDRNTGNLIGNFSSVIPLYIQDNRLLATGPLGYPIIDLTTGTVLEIVSESQAKEKLARLTPEKIFEFSITAGEPFFRGRYDDLERKHFILSALTPDGRTLWSKRDAELSNKLEGEPFADPEQGPLARLSADALYFTNGDYLVCVSLHDGSVIWLLDL